jgi:hypothetical protein
MTLFTDWLANPARAVTIWWPGMCPRHAATPASTASRGRFWAH